MTRVEVDEAHRNKTITLAGATDGEVACWRPGGALVLVSGANERGDTRGSYRKARGG